MNKRAVLIYLLILLSLLKLPNEKLPLKEYETNEQTQIADVINIDSTKEVSISSRALEEPRKVEDEVQEPIYATTYSETLVEYVKRPNVEGFHEKAYICQEDNEEEKYYTIGYGHHDKSIKATDTITMEAADRLLRAELNGSCEIVLKHCAYLGGLTQGELDALTDFTYNGGLPMLKQLTANKTRSKEEIKKHITAYTNGGVRGLVNRRNAELEMFEGVFENEK